MTRMDDHNPPLYRTEIKIYRDKNDWWIGLYRGPHHYYIVLVPTLVIRIKR